MVTGQTAGDGFERLVSVVERADSFSLSFSSAIEAADVLCELSK
jgi:hypothetical protein